MDWKGWKEDYCTTGRHVVEGTGIGTGVVVWREKCACCGAVVETPAIKPNKAQ